MESTYTAGEWILKPISEQQFDFIITDDRISDEKRLPICAIYASNINEHAKGNAQRIVKCVNAHDELVKGYEKLLIEYEFVLKLLAEASNTVYSENNFVITNKQLLKKVTDTTPIEV